MPASTDAVTGDPIVSFHFKIEICQNQTLSVTQVRHLNIRSIQNIAGPMSLPKFRCPGGDHYRAGGRRPDPHLEPGDAGRSGGLRECGLEMFR